MDTQKLILPLLIVAVLLGGTSLAISLINKPAEAPVTVAPSQMVKLYCEESGGTYANGSCACGMEDGEQLTYEASSGQCLTVFGSPGGEAGIAVKNALAGVMTKPSESYLVTLDDYLVPTGAAKISGYKTTITTLASFDPEDKIECDAFAITSAPDELLNGLKKLQFIQRTTEGYPLIALAEKGNYGLFDGTSKQKPADAIALVNSTFEGGVAGCMSVPFELIWPL